MKYLLTCLFVLGICAPLSAQRTHNTHKSIPTKTYPTEHLKKKVEAIKEHMEKKRSGSESRKPSSKTDKVGDVWMAPWLKLKKEQEQKSSQCGTKGCKCACHKKQEDTRKPTRGSKRHHGSSKSKGRSEGRRGHHRTISRVPLTWSKGRNHG